MAEKTVAYIIRHGTTDYNSANPDEARYRGQLNIPLDKKGKEDAEKLRDFFSDKEIGKAWTSDLSRASDTARTILRGKNIPATRDRDLRPLDAGKFAGKKKSEYKDEMKEYQDDIKKKIPGGESIDNLHRRNRRPLLKALRAGVSGKPSLVSTHSSVIHSLGHILHSKHDIALVEPGGVVQVNWDGKKFNAKPVLKPKTKMSKAEKNPEYAS